jgi:hypothetical protein
MNLLGKGLILQVFESCLDPAFYKLSSISIHRSFQMIAFNIHSENETTLSIDGWVYFIKTRLVYSAILLTHLKISLAALIIQRFAKSVLFLRAEQEFYALSFIIQR